MGVWKDAMKRSVRKAEANPWSPVAWMRAGQWTLMYTIAASAGILLWVASKIEPKERP